MIPPHDLYEESVAFGILVWRAADVLPRVGRKVCSWVSGLRAAHLLC